MDKNAIKKFAVWARTELIARVSLKSVEYGITEDNIVDATADEEIQIEGKLIKPVGNPDMLTYEFSPKTITAPSTGQTESYTVTVTYGIDELKRPEGDTKVYSVPEDTVISFTVTSA